MANEIPTNDGMNIETLKIDIDVSAKKSNDNVDALEKSLSRLEKRLGELKKVTKSTESTLNGFSSGKNASRVEKSANEICCLSPSNTVNKICLSILASSVYCD